MKNPQERSSILSRRLILLIYPRKEPPKQYPIFGIFLQESQHSQIKPSAYPIFPIPFTYEPTLSSRVLLNLKFGLNNGSSHPLSLPSHSSHPHIHYPPKCRVAETISNTSLFRPTHSFQNHQQTAFGLLSRYQPSESDPLQITSTHRLWKYLEFSRSYKLRP